MIQQAFNQGVQSVLYSGLGKKIIKKQEQSISQTSKLLEMQEKAKQHLEEAKEAVRQQKREQTLRRSANVLYTPAQNIKAEQKNTSELLKKQQTEKAAKSELGKINYAVGGSKKAEELLGGKKDGK